MRIDMHCHALGKGNDITAVDRGVYFNPEDNQRWFTRILYNLLEEDLVKLEADLNHDQMISTEEYFTLLYRLLFTSEELDALVLLALDAVYSPRDGRLDEGKTDLWVSNRFLLSEIMDLNEKMRREGATKRFFLGASVSPNRPEEYVSICKIGNPFDRDVRIKRAHGFPDSVIGNALKVLRLPDPPMGTRDT